MSAKSDRDTEFTQYVQGVHESQKSYRRYVLGQLATARTRLKLMINEIDAIRVALESGAIDDDRALGDLAQCGGLWFLQPAPIEACTIEQASNTEQQNGF
jgi:hypothetical protein